MESRMTASKRIIHLKNFGELSQILLVKKAIKKTISSSSK